MYCAKYHNDKHVVKMIVETAQLLCTSHWVTNGKAPYKPCHINHPCSKWVREDLYNYEWLTSLGMNLCWEYQKRYGKTHKSYEIIWWCYKNPPNIPRRFFTQPPQAMPSQYKVVGDSVSAYRKYYIGEKISFSTWKNNETPDWFKI